jgi:hypothetical protein
MRCLLRWLILGLAGLYVSNPARSGPIEQLNGLKVLHLEGSPYTRGRVHGSLLKKEIHALVKRWARQVESDLEMPLDSVVIQFIKKTRYLEVIRQEAPDLLEEVRGISDGAELDFYLILGLQISEELEDMRSTVLSHRCTALGTGSGKNPACLAQNVDLPPFLHGDPVLLHIRDRDSELEAFVYTFPGFIGLNGMNSHRVAVTCNSISMLNYDTHGLPVSFIVRRILQAECRDEVVDWVKSVNHATPQTYTIGGPEGPVCLECSANQIRRFTPFEDRNLVWHTNHPLVNRDFNERFIALLSQYGKTVDDPYYCPRFDFVYQKLEANGFNVSPELIKSILASREPELQRVYNDLTYGCEVMVLSDTPEFHIAPGQMEQVYFTIFRFDSAE